MYSGSVVPAMAYTGLVTTSGGIGRRTTAQVAGTAGVPFVGSNPTSSIMAIDFDKRQFLHFKKSPEAPLLMSGSVLALDLSTKTGWAAIGYNKTLNEYWCEAGRVTAPAVDKSYPHDFLDRATRIAESVYTLSVQYLLDAIIIEETNGSKSRYAQKMLEFIHCSVLNRFRFDTNIPIIYINSSDWRKVMGIQLTKEQKKQNQTLSRKLREGKTKKEIGIRGKITKKHLALNYVNSLFEEEFKVKDNDVAEAICLGLAYGKDITKHGFRYCDGK